MIQELQLFLDMGCYPMEAANINHWWYDETSRRVLYLAPQWIILDRSVAYDLNVLPLFNYRRKCAREEIEAQILEQAIVLWIFFLCDRFKPLDYQCWSFAVVGTRMRGKEFLNELVPALNTVTASQKKTMIKLLKDYWKNDLVHNLSGVQQLWDDIAEAMNNQTQEQVAYIDEDGDSEPKK